MRNANDGGARLAEKKEDLPSVKKEMRKYAACPDVFTTSSKDFGFSVTGRDSFSRGRDETQLDCEEGFTASVTAENVAIPYQKEYGVGIGHVVWPWSLEVRNQSHTDRSRIY